MATKRKKARRKLTAQEEDDRRVRLFAAREARRIARLSPGAKLAHHRAINEMTQGEMAGLIGISRTFYQQLESGQRPVREADLVALLHSWYGIDPKDWLAITPFPRWRG